MRGDDPEAEFRAGDITYSILGCAMEVANTLGHGLHEKPYENALLLELTQRGLKVAQQCRYEVLYKGHVVGEYIPDLVVGDRVIVDTKVVEKITDHDRGQMLNYLRISGLSIGLLINFKRSKLEWERMAL
jgi:GxxExxY protein